MNNLSICDKIDLTKKITLWKLIVLYHIYWSVAYKS